MQSSFSQEHLKTTYAEFEEQTLTRVHYGGLKKKSQNYIKVTGVRKLFGLAPPKR